MQCFSGEVRCHKDFSSALPAELIVGQGNESSYFESSVGRNVYAIENTKITSEVAGKIEHPDSRPCTSQYPHSTMPFILVYACHVLVRRETNFGILTKRGLSLHYHNMT